MLTARREQWTYSSEHDARSLCRRCCLRWYMERAERHQARATPVHGAGDVPDSRLGRQYTEPSTPRGSHHRVEEMSGTAAGQEWTPCAQGISKKKKTARAAQAEGPKGKTGTKEAATKREGAPTRSQGPSEVAPASSSPARATARLAGSPSRSMATPPQSMQAATVARGTPPSRASTSQKPAPQRSPLGLSPLGRLAPTVPGSAGRMSGQKRGRTAGESPGSDAAGRGARKLQAGASGGEEMATPVLRRRQVEDSPRDRVMLGLGAAVGPGSMEAAAGEVDTPSQIVRARQVMHAGKTPHKTRAVVGAEGGTADVTPTGASSRPRAPRVPATPSVLKSSKVRRGWVGRCGLAGEARGHGSSA